MPFIDLKTTCIIDSEKEKALKTSLGKAIECIPGKNEQWLMINIESGCTMYFGGTNDAPIVFTEVKIFGKSTPEAFNNMTAEVCKIFKNLLGVPPERVFVKYEECFIWGCNGKNF